MQKNIIAAIAMVIIGASSFYGGMKYDQTKNSLPERQFGNFTQNQKPQLGQADRLGLSGSMGGRRINGAQNDAVIGGEIIAKDERSLTVKTPDGSTKLIFISDKTNASKQVDIALSDLTVGETIMANGEANQDGSVNGSFVQIRNKTLK